MMINWNRLAHGIRAQGPTEKSIRRGLEGLKSAKTDYILNEDEYGELKAKAGLMIAYSVHIDTILSQLSDDWRSKSKKGCRKPSRAILSFFC